MISPVASGIRFTNSSSGADWPPRSLLVEGHKLVAGREFRPAEVVGRRKRRIYPAKFEQRRRLDLVDNVRVVLGVDTGQFDLDTVVAHRPDQGLGHAEGVDPRADDLDRLAQLLFLDVVGVLGRDPGVDLEGDGHAASQVEAELELALGAQQQLIEKDIVSPLDILQRTFQENGGKVLGDVDSALIGYLLQGDKLARGLSRLFAGLCLVQQFAEFGVLEGGVILGVADEGDVLERNELRDRPGSDDYAEHNLPEVAFEHEVVGIEIVLAGNLERRRTSDPAAAL